MLRSIVFLLLLATPPLSWGQANTEVYLFDLETVNGNPVLTNPKNISNNQGYDNQPSFWDDNTVLFSSTRADQTDILRFNIEGGSTKRWITNTPTGSEYSPLKIPGKEAISSIRLDLDGLQRLYEYDLKTGESNLIFDDLKVGYHVWFNEHIVVSTVLVGNRMDLVVSNLQDGSNRTFQKNVGRSLLKIPDSQRISYISKENKAWEIKSLDPISGATEKVADVVKQSEDICWLNGHTILTGIGKSILKFDTKTETGWEPILQFEQEEINNITRITINKSGNRLAFVSEESPIKIIDQQVKTFNDRDLYGFVSCYSEDVLVEKFPNETMYRGRTKMSENYERFYQNTKDASVEVVNRIRIGNKVIDEEISWVDGRKGHQVAIYEVKNGLIASMRFIFPEWETNDAESVVKEQLVAYNARDIDGFMATYSNDIKLYNFPNDEFSQGQPKMKERYKSFFDSTPDLNCEIKNRIVIGNKVIDEEYITANNSNFSAVAIYEVKNGKINKVTFLR